MSKFVEVAKTSDIGPGEAKIVEVHGTKIAIFHCGGKFYATQNDCLHMKGSLGDGKLDGCIITCPRHGWRYNVMTGENEMMSNVILKTYELLVERGVIKVKV